ncbi:hypothetical protein [Loktanella atrilutea]|uniref:hypothetical protein n=1 Tax=Loktanella atrilutea TaxID=366533 RepID=UPI001FE828DC|nr:hypothetical protein [Loktanella atrilutea]
MTELPTRDEMATGKFHQITYACQRGAGCFDELFNDVIDGRVQALCRSDKIGIGAIVVDNRSLASIEKFA